MVAKIHPCTNSLQEPPSGDFSWIIAKEQIVRCFTGQALAREGGVKKAVTPLRC
jgi:hypothetical protein